MTGVSFISRRLWPMYTWLRICPERAHRAAVADGDPGVGRREARSEVLGQAGGTCGNHPGAAHGERNILRRVDRPHAVARQMAGTEGGDHLPGATIGQAERIHQVLGVGGDQEMGLVTRIVDGAAVDPAPLNPWGGAGSGTTLAGLPN